MAPSNVNLIVDAGLNVNLTGHGDQVTLQPQAIVMTTGPANEFHTANGDVVVNSGSAIVSNTISPNRTAGQNQSVGAGLDISGSNLNTSVKSGSTSVTIAGDHNTINLANNTSVTVVGGH